MLETPSPSPSVFTATSAYSLAGVAGIAIIAKTSRAGALLPRNAPWQGPRRLHMARAYPNPFPTQTISRASLTTAIRFHLRLRHPKTHMDIMPKQPLNLKNGKPET